MIPNRDELDQGWNPGFYRASVNAMFNDKLYYMLPLRRSNLVTIYLFTVEISEAYNDAFPCAVSTLGDEN